MKNSTFTTLISLAILLLNLLAWSSSASEVNIPGKYTTTYFSTRNGVEDGLVNDMIQDHKGLLWFATWNGLYRFDGYNFRNYKSNAEDQGGLTNDRLQQITEDKYGCIWVLCYDSTAYRFHPGKEIFEPVPKASATNFQSIHVLPDGVVWLLYTDGSALRALTRQPDLSLTLELYSSKENTLPAGKIQTVFPDSNGQEWILTDNGLYCLHHDRLSTIVGGESEAGKQQAFYCAAEKDGVLLLGGNRGRTYVCPLKEKSVTVKQLETTASVISIRNEQDKTIYITDNDGFFIIDPVNRSNHFTLNRLTLRKDKTIESALVTCNHLLWLTHPGPGVTLFDLDTQEFREFTGRDEAGRPLNTETGFFVIEGRNNILWVHPKGGAFSYYDPQRKELIPFNTTEQSIKWKSNDRCFAAFSDKQGNLWMSTQLNRLKRVTFIPDRFHFHIPSPEDPDLPENEIRALHIDRKGRIWTGGRDLNISVYDARFNLLHQFKAGKVYAITQDADQRIYWISTKGEGLIKATETSNGHFECKRYIYDANDPYTISSDNIYYLFQDSKKRRWVATYGGGLNLIEPQPDGSLRFINHRNRLKNYPIQRFYKTRHITEDHEGNIWISTTAGILHLNGNFREPETIEFDQIRREQGNTHSLSNNDVHMVKCTAKGHVFAATYGGGLNEILKTSAGIYRCNPFTQKNGLISDIIYAIQEDHNGNIWLVTGGGLVKFINAQEQTQYPSEHIAFNMHFSEGEGATDGNRIFFGTNRGVFYFAPGKIDKTDFVPQIFFSSIWVNNEELSIGDSSHITLPPNNHSLRLVFSALDMTNTEYTHYAYMLRGFDKVYRQTDHGHEANYTNLPPGKYTFHVRSTNSEGVWVDNERTLSIEVLPTFRETPYAGILLFMLILIAGLAIIYIYTVFYRMKQKVKNEEYLAQLKLSFFTNVSHELRTPLTLITGPLEMILKNDALPEKLKESLNTIRKNSERMQRLVGQILDFSKIRDNKMRLHIQCADIVRFTQDIAGHFMGIAGERHITLTFTSASPVCYLWFDEDKIEKVIFNLLSNAFKYTPDHKCIQVDVTETTDAVLIRITDQGIGIPAEKQNSIFNRFENLVQKSSYNTMSSGIGLSLAKELTEMHRGNITVNSEKGTGSIFTVTLLKGKTHYAAGTEYIVGDPEPENSIALPEPDEPCDGSALLMLIVEDNHELRSFIKQVFQEKFRIIEAQDGSEGLEKAFAFLPDIVITDIMMPVKDGIRMLQELRDDERTSHIPAIILTAKSDMDSILTGIQTGADDYITKPFSTGYLQSKVDHLLAQRKKLQAFYNRNTAEHSPAGEEKEPLPQLSGKDRAFLAKLSEVMEAQMGNPDLSVDHIVGYFNLSRTNFFHKLKSLTGFSPVLYIRNVRMRRAAELIRERQYTVSEIAYRVGYNDPHYFSRIFKAFWGMNATEYAGK